MSVGFSGALALSRLRQLRVDVTFHDQRTAFRALSLLAYVANNHGHVGF